MIKNKVCDMKIGLKILMSLAMSLLFCSYVEEGYDVYLCIGQSAPLSAERFFEYPDG